MHNQEPDDECGPGCPILNATFWADIGTPDYPNQWVQDDDGKNPRCTAFNPIEGTRDGEIDVSTLTPEQLEWYQRIRANNQR